MTAFKLEHTLLNPVSIAVRDSVVQQGIWVKAYGTSENGLVHSSVETSSSTTTENGRMAVQQRLSLRVEDRVGLLRDLSLALLAHRVDVDSLTAYTLGDSSDRGFEAGSGHAQIEAEVVSDRPMSSSDWAALMETLKMTASGGIMQSGAPRNIIDTVAAIGSSRETTGKYPNWGGGTRAGTREGTYDDSSAPGMGKQTLASKGSLLRGPGGLKKAESIADLNRFQMESSKVPSWSGQGIRKGAVGGGSGIQPPMPPAPEHQFMDSPIHPTRTLGSASPMLHRSFSVADMKTNVTSGGSSGALSGSGGGFRPGMPQSVTHSASSKDLLTTEIGSLWPSTRPVSASGLNDRMMMDSDENSLSQLPEISRVGEKNDYSGRTSPSGSKKFGSFTTAEIVTRATSPTLGSSVCKPGSPAPATLFGGPNGFPELSPPRRDRSTKDYTLLRELGRGLCGTVYLGREKDTGNIVAFKVMRKSKLVDVGEANHASVERRIHEQISSGPFINRLIASFQDPWALFLVLEYAPCGDLFQAMNFHGLPSRNDAIIYTMQVFTALDHLHALSYVYRDLKPENILLHTNGSVQLADFGMCKQLRSGERTFTICGTAQYMSPEVLLHQGCYFEADLWAMGIFIYELSTGDTPFSSNSDSRQELYRRLMSHDPDKMILPNQIDRKTASLVKGLLQNDESKRLGSGRRMYQLYQHPWFDGVDLEAVQAGTITPDLNPRRRNVINDPTLQKVLASGDIPWQRGNVIDDPNTVALFEKF